MLQTNEEYEIPIFFHDFSSKSISQETPPCATALKSLCVKIVLTEQVAFVIIVIIIDSV